MASSPLPRDLSEPIWLQGLVLTQQLSLTVAVSVTAGLLAVYGWSVHTQAQWNQQYQKLQLLKRQERKLAAAMETFENDLVANLQRYTGNLIKEEQSQSIYLALPPPPPPPAPPAPAPHSPIPTHPRLLSPTQVHAYHPN